MKVMRARFVPCPSCARHVKQSDSTCPFCGNEIPNVIVPARRVAAGRLSRSALFAAGAAGLALATMDCGSAQSSYGGPVVCTSADGSATGCANLSEAGVLSANDAGSEDASGGSGDAVVPPMDGGGG